MALDDDDDEPTRAFVAGFQASQTLREIDKRGVIDPASFVETTVAEIVQRLRQAEQERDMFRRERDCLLAAMNPQDASEALAALTADSHE